MARNTSGLRRITAETAREMAERSAAARRPTEPQVRAEISIPARLGEEIRRRGLNRTALIRRLLEAELSR